MSVSALGEGQGERDNALQDQGEGWASQLVCCGVHNGRPVTQKSWHYHADSAVCLQEGVIQVNSLSQGPSQYIYAAA